MGTSRRTDRKAGRCTAKSMHIHWPSHPSRKTCVLKVWWKIWSVLHRVRNLTETHSTPLGWTGVLSTSQHQIIESDLSCRWMNTTSGADYDNERGINVMWYWTRCEDQVWAVWQTDRQRHVDRQNALDRWSFRYVGTFFLCVCMIDAIAIRHRFN